MPTNERAIAAAAYAAAHSRSKGCPLLGQIAYRAFMEEAHEHIAHECPTHFHVVMGEHIIAEGQSESTDVMDDQSNIRTNALGDLEPHASSSQSVSQGVEENGVEIPVEDDPENRAESKISNGGVKTEDHESKITGNDRPHLKLQSEDQESMMIEESMDHNHVTVANEFGSCFDVDDGSKFCADGEIVVPGDVVKDVYDKSIAEMKMNVSKHAEAWGTTSFKDPEFWGTTTSSKDAETWGTTNFKDPGLWGSASPTTNDDMPWDEMMKSKIWHPFKYSEYPVLNEITVF